MKPNAQHKALRQSGIFRPRVERDRRRQLTEAELIRDEQEHNFDVQDWAYCALIEERIDRRHGQ